MINNNSLYKISIIISSILTLFSVIYVTYVKNISVDELEHIQATFNIYYGMHPYRDFFEHHHGLMWYISALILAPYFNHEVILFAIRTLVFTMYLLLLLSQYKICRLLKLSPLKSLIALILFSNIREMQYSAIEFRADTLMTSFFMFGIYYFLTYITSKKFKDIFISFIFFFLSFAVLQKIIISLMPIFFIIVYLLKNKQLELTELLKATIIPFLLFLTYIAYLYSTGGLQDYYESCWILNYMIKFTTFPHSIFYKIALTIGSISTLYVLLKHKNKISKIYAIITLFNNLLILTVFPPYYPQYYIVPYSLNIITTTIFLSDIIDYKKINQITISLLLIIISISLAVYNKTLEKSLSLPIQSKLIKHIIDNSSPTDYIIGNYYVGGVRRLATGYYWFDFNTSSRVHQQLFPRRKFPDLNKIIQRTKPKIIASEGVIWYDCVDDEFKAIPCKIEQTLDKKSLEKDYTYNSFIYIRKY